MSYFDPTENVYNNLKEEEKVKKPVRYKAKNRLAAIIEQESKQKDAMKTMGPPKVELPSPDKFLKKHSKQFKPPAEPEHFHKPPAPLRTDKPQIGIQSKKVFSQKTDLVPVTPKPSFIETKKQLLENSGLIPKYIRKKGLKKKWDEVYHEYQLLPFVIDTVTKKKERIFLEEKMTQLEKDISVLEKFKTIYISSS
ncbi:enkurin isoform X2 [Cyprinodon tularosa]|uniref:enkurin isoform X2 n=1 Tax=Cyprinodon tularosa TaxID=77115 RepID=UPI0018E243DD|nr:enkurin isoform X2 [Cyprinodon tularosa]